MPRFTAPSSSRWRCAAAISALALVAACGGGGAPATSSRPSPQPAPTPTPSPTPAPTPTPTPTPGAFNTQELSDSDGPAYHNAIAAWESGATGAGSVIAIIDSGIDSDSPEFAGRIHPASADVAGSRGIDGIDDHGTNVALVAAAARNGSGILGMAFDAQVLAIRADEPGSCSGDTPQDPSLNCLFSDASIAAGVDLAVAEGAQVINISLGGGGATSELLDAVARAADAGVVIIVAAGNGGDGSEAGIDPDQPDPFAASLLQAGGANVIIVGSIDANGQLSDFSNRAGNAAASYLTARGEALCCVYQDGEIFVENINGQQFVTLFSGTSFSAPQVAGAVALLAQAFPNLTGAEIVEILLGSALDAGPGGTDGQYGRGILDIARAFAPAGTTTLAGQQTAMGLGERMAIASPAMGDAFAGQGLKAVVTDRYRRAYRVELGRGLSAASAPPRLAAALERRGRHIALAQGGATMAFHVSDAPDARGGGMAAPLQLGLEDAQRAQVLAARVATRIAPGMAIAIAYAQGAQGLVASLQEGEGRDGPSRKGPGRAPAFRIAPAPHGSGEIVQAHGGAIALRREFGEWGLSLFAETGESLLGYSLRRDEALYRPRERFAAQSYGVALDRRLGALAATLGVSWLREERSVLGARFHPALVQRGADSLFVDAAARWQPGDGWFAGTQIRLGLTRARPAEVLARAAPILSSSWALDIGRSGVFARADMLALRIGQPLRVEAGGMSFDLPTSYDYASEMPGYARQHLSLVPSGREVVGELAWQAPLARGQAAASLFHRHQPGHHAARASDLGAMVSFTAAF